MAVKVLNKVVGQSSYCQLLAFIIYQETSSDDDMKMKYYKNEVDILSTSVVHTLEITAVCNVIPFQTISRVLAPTAGVQL